MTMRTQHPAKVALIAVLLGVATLAAQPQQPPQQGDGQSFRFRSAVELINVTAAVTDESGRFVPGLRKEDFRIFEDGVEQPITHFSSERVPVSLGVALDTSSSMEGEKIMAARDALNRFLFDLLDPSDEVFLYRFANAPELVENWTTDRQRIRGQLGRLVPRGGTAMYDAVSEAVPLAQTGRNKKRALVLISDGNDTSSHVTIRELKQQIRQAEVIVYAVGIDGQATTQAYPGAGQPRARPPMPFPFPMPGTRRPPSSPPYSPPSGPGGGGSRTRWNPDERVNVTALRDITDDSGGRTEIVRSGRDLDPATASIADELSKQYYLGYPSTGKKDGLWHTIRVELRDQNYRVRARRGYVASP
jgi:Ca-activated chloride channel homolog